MRWPSIKTSIVPGLAAAALVAVGMTGCGSDGGGQGDEAGARAAFLERANEICDQHNDFLRQAMIESFGPEQKPGDEAGIRFTREVWIPDMRRQDEQLRELDWPEADQEKIDSMLKEVLRVADQVEASPETASQGPFDQVTDELTAYGIGSCGSP